jgi:leucyl aminopeptidase (aminopeptidase T)
MRSPHFAVGALLLVAACTPPAPVPDADAATAEAAPPAVALMPVADRLVTRNLGVKPGDHVLITGTPEHIELLEDLALQVRQEGGWPLITVESDRLARMRFDSVAEARDADAPSLALPLARTFPMVIALEGAGSADNLGHVSPARFAAIARAGESVTAQINRMPRKLLFLGNGLFPNEETARRHGMTLADLTELFWAGVNVDPDAMAAAGSAVRAALRTAREIQVTAPGGTDLTLSLVRGEPFFSDGAITDEDGSVGPVGFRAWLPAGEVYQRIAAGSANGTIVADRVAWEDAIIENLRVTVENGRVTSMTAASGMERLQATYDAAGAGRDAVAIFDIGVNTSMSLPPGSQLRNYAPAGMVTIFVGNDLFAGGSNTAAFAVPLFLTGATVTVDGTPVVENGTLRVGGGPR